MNKFFKGVETFGEFTFCLIIIGSGVAIGYELVTYGLRTMKDL